MRQGLSYNLALQLLPAHDRGEARSRALKAASKDRVLQLAWLEKTGWTNVAGSLAVVSFTTIVGFFVEPIIKGANLAILYMLAVMFSALLGSRRTAILTAVFCGLSLGYFFHPPLRSFVVNDLWRFISLFGF